eukprot:446570_1
METKLHFGIGGYGPVFQTFDHVYRGLRRSSLWIRYASNSCVAKDISYQFRGGVGYIEISNILFIAYGHWTKLFKEYSEKNVVDKELCFSIISKPKYGTFDVIADDKEIAKKWMKKLRDILGHSNDFSLKLSQKYIENNFFHNYCSQPLHIDKCDDFTVAVLNVYKQLINAKKWNIDYMVKFNINTEYLSGLLQQENIKWIEWNQWIKSKITNYLRSNCKFGVVAKKCLILGYIRNFEYEHKTLIIPEDVTLICLAMYGVEIDPVDQYLDDNLPGLNNYFRGNAFYGHSMEELSVFGYLRNICNNTEHKLIFYHIFNLCLLYLSDDEYWNKYGVHCKLSKNGMVVTKMSDNNDFDNMTFCAKLINGNNALNHPIRVQWKLKVFKNGLNNHGIRIGLITKAEQCRVNADIMDIGPSFSAFYYCSNKNIVKVFGKEYYFPVASLSSFVDSDKDGICNIEGNGMCLGENDIIDIQLDLCYTNKLEYFVNGKSIGVYFKHVPFAKYKLFISIQHKDDSVELLGFTKKYIYKKPYLNGYGHGADLFPMTINTVFRNLKEERKWDIDQKCRDVMNARYLYGVAMQQDIHWRDWSQWIRSHVIAYLSQHNRNIINSQQQSFYHSNDTMQINKDMNPDQECVIM